MFLWLSNVDSLSLFCKSKTLIQGLYPVNIYLFKVISQDIRKWCEICSELTIKTPERCKNVVLVPLLLTLNIFHTFFKCFYWWFWTGKCFFVRFHFHCQELASCFTINLDKSTYILQCICENSGKIELKFYKTRYL